MSYTVNKKVNTAGQSLPSGGYNMVEKTIKYKSTVMSCNEQCYEGKKSRIWE